uniref:Uncharacterized protein n=1 Tax=Manihot esculenta TaxID=3983 RepID=A0A2C9V643_MANES
MGLENFSFSMLSLCSEVLLFSVLCFGGYVLILLHFLIAHNILVPNTLSHDVREF